jgi:hypothetical protein
MPHPAEESQKHNLSKIRPHSLAQLDWVSGRVDHLERALAKKFPRDEVLDYL